MKKITDLIVDKHKMLLIIFLLISIFCIFLMKKVNINSDMSKYLPKTSETKIGNDIMNNEFEPIQSSTLYVMIENIENKEEILNYLKTIENVEEVQYENTENYNKEKNTLYILTTNHTSDSKEAKQIFDTVEEHFKKNNITLYGDIADSNQEVLPSWISILAVSSAVIILIIMSDNLIEPFLILYAVGIAVFLNKGSNILFESISNVTDGIVAILQMALSMDYSIILINRFKQEKEKTNNKDAMKKALYKSVGAISGSSVTTIVGLLVLVFMSFTIGRDLGIILAKGVLLSLISIFFCLPGLLLIFDKLITKTKKKVIIPKFKKLSKFSYKFRYTALITMVLLFIISSILKGNLTYLYTESRQNKIEKTFKVDNQMALIYKNDNEEEINTYCESLEKNENINKVLCYGNTIGKKLKYNELKPHVEKLGENIDNIDDYILKIIYYNYYNKNLTNKITFDEFITFITSDIYNNKDLESKIENKKEIETLKYFTSKQEIYKERNIKELADIFGIKEQDLQLLLIYYNSNNTNIELTLQEFIDLINNEIIPNPQFKTYIDEETNKNLQLLSKYTKDINKQMTNQELAQYFELNEDLVNALYTYYISDNDIDIKLTPKEFIQFTLEKVITNPLYKEYFNEQIIENLKELYKYTDDDYLNKKLNSKQLSEIYNIEEQKIKELLFLYYSEIETSDSYTIIELLENIKYIKENTNYLDNLDYEEIINNSDIFNINLNKETLYNYFNEKLINNIYEIFNLDDEFNLSIRDIITILSPYLENVEKYIKETNLDKEIINNIDKYLDTEIKENVKEYINENILNNIEQKKYTSQELAQLLKIDNNTTRKIYALIKLVNNDTEEWKITPKEFIKLLLNNKEYLKEDEIKKLELLNNIINTKDTKYTYKELAQTLNIEDETIKKIYSLYVTQTKKIAITPYEIVKFIIKNQDNPLFNPYMDKIYLINNIFESIQNNTKYTYQELSQILNTDQEKIKLIYGLYDKNQTITIEQFTNFIVNDVLNSEYKNKFKEEEKNKIIIINSIVNNSIKDTKYNKDEMITILSQLSDIDKNTIELLYIYYGSEKQYDNSYELTLQELVEYLNEDVLKDKRFEGFIDKEAKEKIENAKVKIEDAYKMLVGKEYSRMIMLTNYEKENKTTFDFVNDTRNELKNHEVYLIGNSPMAYDISKTFNSELNFITILTIISIYIVVAITFKSLISPLVITLIIQSSVFITMGILSFSKSPVYFISLLVVQSILMGATIDYGIVYTTYFLENRKKHTLQDSIKEAYEKSSHTIMTSGCILIIVTLIVGIFADGVTSKICLTITEGTTCSVILILFILPGVLAALDKIIVKQK